MNQVYTQNRTFFKSWTGKCPDSGKRLASLSASLAAAGVPTPIGRYEVAAHRLAFPKLLGIEARRLIQLSTGDVSSIHWLWPLVINPLISLHSVDPTGLRLNLINPLRHVSRRILNTTDDTLAFPVSGLHDSLQELIEHDLNHSNANFIVAHGDYHVGQILIDTIAHGSAVVDLDDVGLGIAEMDLSNLIAHLVTSPNLPLQGPEKIDGSDRTVDRQFLFWSDKLTRLYRADSTRSINSQRMALYGAGALMRRALKLNESGHTLDQIQSILQGADTLYASSLRSTTDAQVS